MTDEYLLKVDDLHTEFSTPEGLVKAVDGLSFTVTRGQTLGILGESGCGKSVTALSILNLISRPAGNISRGTMVFDNLNLERLSDKQMRQVRGNRISMIFQEPMTSLNPLYTVGDQIAEVFTAHHRVRRKTAMARAVSGGMRQRVMIAIALACRPELLIADEPTTALDVTIQAQILDLMMELKQEYGMAMMMITHDLGVIAEVSDYVLVMYAGQAMEYAPAETLFDNPRHPYTKGIMQSVPRLGEKFIRGRKPLDEIPGIVPSLHHLPPGCLFEPRCREAKDLCKHQKPPLKDLEKTVKCRCWLAT